MAKSNGFFTLRRGSTKSLTFQVMNGKQITKDRVSSVRNPRTQRQQFQRSIMGTIMAAYSHMKAIEDHAFQGKAKGAMNQHEFMRINLNKLRAAIMADYNASRSAADCTGFVNIPKSGDLVANAYAISRGGLENQKLFVNRGAEIESADNTLHIDLNVEDTANFRVSEFLEGSGLVPGSQITFCYIDLGVNSKKYIPGSGQAAGWSYIPGVFRYARLVVPKDIDLSHEFDQDNQTQKEFVEGVLAYVFNSPKSTISEFVVNVETVGSEQVIKLNLEETLPNFDPTFTGALGIITSIEDTGERSNSDMVVYGSDSNITAGNIGITWEAVPALWDTAGDLGDSELYLEGGSI